MLFESPLVLVGCMTFIFITIVAEGRTVRSTVTKCPKPKVVNGQVHVYGDKAEYGPNEEAKISCDNAYRLVGKDRLRCNKDGAWSTNPPYCEIKKCHRPLDIMNGSIEVEEPALIQKEAKFHCDQGFVLVGPHRLECGMDEKWIPYTMPRCEEVSCPKLPEIPGLKYKQQPSLGGYVEFECDEGFARMQGKAVLHCDNNRTWVPNEMPYCETITPKENTNEYMIGFFILLAIAIGQLIYIVWRLKRCTRGKKRQNGANEVAFIPQLPPP